MQAALVKMHGEPAGVLEKSLNEYRFTYLQNYKGEAISLTLPVREDPYLFSQFPSFFDGLLPEGPQLEGLLRDRKIDRDDHMSQLVAVGEDLVGAATVYEYNDD
ncbi:HipA N-terminal domain-containing protein [Oligoflexia bacterium]|nr:HipA N-terminal domain-containing protein [Oligoflexia bacterium]